VNLFIAIEAVPRGLHLLAEKLPEGKGTARSMLRNKGERRRTRWSGGTHPSIASMSSQRRSGACSLAGEISRRKQTHHPVLFRQKPIIYIVKRRVHLRVVCGILMHLLLSFKNKVKNRVTRSKNNSCRANGPQRMAKIKNIQKA